MSEQQTASIETLQKDIPDLDVSTDPSNLETYGLDWTRFYTPQAWLGLSSYD